MRAIKFNDEIIHANKGEWHVDLMANFMRREGLDHDAMDILIDNGSFKFGYVHWDTKDEKLVWSEKKHHYRSTDHVYEGASL